MHTPIVLIVVQKSVNKQTTMYGEYSNIPLYQTGFAGFYMNMQIPVVLCCDMQVHCLLMTICCESNCIIRLSLVPRPFLLCRGGETAWYTLFV